MTFIKHSRDRREERRIHRWINQAKYFTIYQSYIRTLSLTLITELSP